MSEGALTRSPRARSKYEWRINASRPGFKVAAVALVDLRRRLFPLRQVELSEFTKQVPFDEKGEPIEPPAVLHGLPARYFYFGVILYLWPPPLHAWRLKVDYAPREETRTRNALGEFTGASKSDLQGASLT